MLVLLGQFDLEGLTQASPLFGPLFFLAYIVCMFFILMNIFLAILGEAYSVVREESDLIKQYTPKTTSIGFRGWVKKMWRRYKAHRAKVRAANAMARQEDARAKRGRGEERQPLSPSKQGANWTPHV